MNILITGASGMLGSALARAFSEDYNVFLTGKSSIDAMNRYGNYKTFDLSLTNYNDLIEWSMPDVIIHCAANTNGNACQKDPLSAFDTNGLSIKRLIDSTSENVKIIYVSTDAVFTSKLHLAKETDCVSPESVYGKSKELGEFFLLNSERNYCILRTTIVGLNLIESRSSFVEWIINSSLNHVDISLFSDVLFTPISIWDFISEIKDVIIEKDVKGVYHIGGSEVCSKFEFGLELLKAIDLPTQYVKASSINEFSDRAKRSNDQTLSCVMYQEKFNRKLPNLKETISKIKQHYYEKN